MIKLSSTISCKSSLDPVTNSSTGYMQLTTPWPHYSVRVLTDLTRFHQNRTNNILSWEVIPHESGLCGGHKSHITLCFISTPLHW